MSDISKQYDTLQINVGQEPAASTNGQVKGY